MYLLLPLTKGHLPNVATVSWQIGGLIREGLVYTQLVQMGGCDVCSLMTSCMKLPLPEDYGQRTLVVFYTLLAFTALCCGIIYACTCTDLDVQ